MTSNRVRDWQLMHDLRSQSSVPMKQDGKANEERIGNNKTLRTNQYVFDGGSKLSIRTTSRRHRGMAWYEATLTDFRCDFTFCRHGRLFFLR